MKIYSIKQDVRKVFIFIWLNLSVDHIRDTVYNVHLQQLKR